MIDDARSIEDGAILDADICIVGAGAAGISLALQFSSASQSVLLLESGGPRPDSGTQALYDGTTVNERLHSPPIQYRQRRFGGSTTIWGGRCIPFDPIDFDARAYMPFSGWPIGYDEVARYYPRANALCEAGAFAYTVETARLDASKPIISGFDSAVISTNTIERFSRPTDFARAYGNHLAESRSVRVLLHANVTRLNTTENGGGIESVDIRTLTGKRITARARRYVLATGGLEVPRLLLASNDRFPQGLGNGHDLVGRFYMCHVAGTLGTLNLKAPLSSVAHGYEVSPDGIYCRRRFAITPEAQREHGIGNFIARLHHPRITDPAHRSGPLSALYLALPLISYEYSRRFKEEGAHGATLWLRHAFNLARDSWGTAAFAIHWLRKRTFAARKFPSVIVKPRSNHLALEFHAEQQPQPDSRVRLTKEVDALGMPRLEVDWRYTALDIETVRVAYRLMKEEFARSGTATLSYDEETLEAVAMQDGAYGGHHLGTARMSASPSNGVVDADCKVHGIDNLYIASGAVMPTSSQANPTLTIVALALRLADHLKRLA
ncbi:MAG TPA: GMC family oxidoreductase [Magnetospirillaceae bacterium]|jgi:choline dehydrogenase-like flavoprotein